MKLANLVKKENLNVKELMVIKGAAGGQGNQCDSGYCSSIKCTSGSCSSSSCSAHTCSFAACIAAMDTSRRSE